MGIQGAITVEVLTDGIVKGGNGGNGANVTEGAPADTKAGFGGEGGKGVALTNGEPTAQPGTIQDGTAGLDGTGGTLPPKPEDKTHTVTFWWCAEV